MFVKLPERLFFIIASLLVILVVSFKQPYFKSINLNSYQNKLFNEFTDQLASDNFDPQYYWQFREKYSPGYFLRDEDNTYFSSTFKLNSIDNNFTPLFYYNSDKLQSVDSLITYDSKVALDKLIYEFPGETIYSGDNFVLIEINQTDYVFAFVESIESMKKVNGMFDYSSAERNILENKLWYNATHISLH